MGGQLQTHVGFSHLRRIESVCAPLKNELVCDLYIWINYKNELVCDLYIWIIKKMSWSVIYTFKLKKQADLCFIQLIFSVCIIMCM